MNEFMKLLLSLSLSGTLLSLLILGGKTLYKNRFSRRWQYYIWLVAALRFLLPFTPDTTVVGSLFEKFDRAEARSEMPPSPDAPVSVNVDNSETTPLQPSRDTAPAAGREPLNLYACLFYIWSAAALVLLARKVTVYQDFIQYIKSGNRDISDIWTLNLLSDCKEKLHIKKRVELSGNSLIDSPIMVGFFRPRIVLPARKLDKNELSYIFMHELTHYRQRDMYYKWLIQLVVCIHWFNPFVYFLEKEVNKACELSCDEKVLSVLGEKARQGYGDMLIAFIKSNNRCKNSFASVTLTEGAEQLKERLGAIMKFRKKSKTVIVLTTICSVIICGCSLVTGAYAAASATDQEKTWKDGEIMNEVMNEDGVYYIFCEGAGEEDKPKSSVSDGKIMFVLVRKGSWTSVGAFDNNETLVEDVRKQCKSMKNLTEKEIELVLETAAGINGNSEPYEYTYTQKGYYCDSYIIEMGWNLSDDVKKQAGYDAAEILLEDKSKMTVYFSDTAKEFANNSGARNAVKKLIGSLRNSNVNPAIEAPLIVNVTPVAVDEIPALTETYFKNEDLIRFSALFAVLEKEAQTEYCQKIYDADKIAFFSSILPNLDEDMILLYADKSEQDDKTNFFAVLTDYMKPRDLKHYAEKYYASGNIARFTVLIDNMTKEEKQDWLTKAQADKKTNFAAVLSDD